MNISRLRTFSLSLSTTALVALPVAAVAQSAPEQSVQASTVEDVIVTARKRAESVIEVPSSLVVLSGADLENKSIRSIADLANSTPGLSLSMTGTPVSSSIVVRGLASANFNQSLNIENNVGFFVDGIYQTSRNTIDVLEVLNVGQVTVAKGPQSALYGRSTFAGAVAVNTRKPSYSPGIDLSTTVGTGNDFRFSAVASGPLIEDVLYGSLKVASSKFGGVNETESGENVGGYYRRGYSGALTYKPTDRLTFEVAGFDVRSNSELPSGYILDYSAHNCGGINAATQAYMLYCGDVPVRDRGTNSVGLPDNVSHSQQLALETRYETDKFTIVSVTGVTKADFRAYFDYDGKTDGDLYGVCQMVGTACPTVDGLASYGRTIYANSVGGSETDVRTFSQELRIQSPDDARLQWIFGGFLFDSKATENAWTSVDGTSITANEQLVMVLPGYAGTNTGPLATLANPKFTQDVNNIQKLINSARVGTQTYSLFGSIGYKFTDDFRASLEARWNVDEKFNNSIISSFGLGAGIQSAKFESLSPRLTLEYDVTDSVMSYFTAAKGVRSGGFNGIAGLLPEETSYEEEENWTYELGLKGELFDRRLFFSLAGYYVDWTNIQVPIYSSNPSIVQSIYLNAGDVAAYGVDIEARYRVTPDLEVGASYAWSSPEYSKGTYDPSQVSQCTPAVCNYVDVPGRGRQPDISGNRPPRSVETQWSLFGQYSRPISDTLTATGRVDVNYVGDQFVNGLNLSQYGERTLTNLRFAVEGERYGVSAWVTNVFDETYVATALTQPRNAYPTVLRTIEAYLGDGRRAGVTLTAKF